MLSAQIQNNNLFAEVTPIQLLHLHGIFLKTSANTRVKKPLDHSILFLKELAKYYFGTINQLD